MKEVFPVAMIVVPPAEADQGDQVPFAVKAAVLGLPDGLRDNPMAATLSSISDEGSVEQKAL